MIIKSTKRYQVMVLISIIRVSFVADLPSQLLGHLETYGIQIIHWKLILLFLYIITLSIYTLMMVSKTLLGYRHKDSEGTRP